MAADVAGARVQGFPLALTPFVGRAEERREITSLLRHAALPLLTLTGPAGTGKTRLAIAAAQALAGDFADGVVFVPLAAISDPELVLPTIAQSLGIWQSSDQPLIDLVIEELQPLQLLLVLDNLEQVIDSATVISRLIRSCPGLRVLATSRVALRLHIEQEYHVPPMGLPAVAETLSAEEIAASEAVALFVQRARSVSPSFALDESNAASVLAICRQLEGLPLAIELAAARVKVLSPQALLARLGNRLQVLTGGARDAPSRLRSMREAIAWSYDLLDSSEQALFRRLAIFVGGFTLEAAEEIMGEGAGFDPDAPSTLDGVASLVDKCLLQQGESPDGEPRFRMLETIREFGFEQLQLAKEDATTAETHAAFFSAFAERCHPEEASGIQQRRLLDALESEHDNLRSALTWLIDHERGVALAGALGWFWYLRGHLAEGRAWLARALAAEPVTTDAAARARSLRAAGKLAWEQADYSQALLYLEENRALSDALGDRAGVAHALLNLGVVAEKSGDDAKAFELYEEALQIFRAIGDRAGVTNALIDLADASFRQGDLARSGELTDEALALSRTAGDPIYEALSLCNAGQLELARGATEEAVQTYRRSMLLAHDVGNRWLVADALGGLAGASVALGDPERGARWLGAAQAMCDALGTPGVPHHAQFAKSVAAIRSHLDEATFDAAFAVGRAGEPDDVVADARDWEPAARFADISPRISQPATGGPGLTERELDVLRLLVAGHSSREIGEALFISPRTASTHVGNILGKLGVNTRSAAVAAAFHLGLVER